MIRYMKGVTLALTIACIAMSACGGGGGGGGTSTPAKSSVCTLSDITLTGAAFDSSFDPDTLSYDAELSDNASPTVTVEVEKAQSGQSISIDGVTGVTSSLTVADTSKSCSIVVTSEDGTATKTYTITIRQKTTTDTNAYLGSFSVTGQTLSPAFSKTQLTYSVTVPSSTVSAVINFSPSSSAASVLFQNTSTTDTSRTVSLSTGSNSYSIKVISADKSATNTYTLTIVRTATYDTSLSSLFISSGTLSPSFSASSLAYTATTVKDSFTVTPTAADPSATITVNGTAVASGTASSAFTFSTSGEKKTVTIKVSLNGSSTSYTLTMTYSPVEPGSAYLSALETNAGTLTFGKQTFAYTGYTVESSVETITVTPTAEDSTASITVDGVAAESGKAATVALAKGEDTIVDITVTDGSKTHTYLILVTRKGEGSTITGVWVNAYIPASWNWPGVYIYYWTDSNTSLTTWAASPKMTAAGSGWYSYHVTEVSTVNAIIKDATGEPTASINKSSNQKNLTGDVYISCPASTWVNTTTRPDGAPSHQGWTAPAKPVFTFSPDGGNIVSGGTVTITAKANSTGATIASSGYLLNGVKVSNLNAFTLNANAQVTAFAKNSIGGADISSRSFTATSATAPTITMTPTSGTFTDTIDVTITTANATVKYYSIDGGDWKAFTESKLTLGADKTAGQSVSLQIKAVNGDTSEEATSAVCTYSKEAEYTEIFSWDNANVYFVMTDRFYNGDTSNDASYGRTNNYNSAGLTADINTATFHGGDIKGLTTKLNAGYFTDLGVNAIWITAPYEQIHGFVGGGWNNSAATYAHYGYHGYYTLDWTEMDKNMGTVEEFRTFVKTAHNKGIRVIVDIVMNHTGYENIADAAEYGYGGVSLSVSAARSWTPTDGNWGGFASLYAAAGNSSWDKWFGSKWVRAGKYNTSTGGNGSGETDDVSFLPDVKNQWNTETSDVGLPPVLVTKWSAEGTSNDSWVVPAAKSLRTNLGVCPAIYQEKWLAAWVEEFGVDGFRVDTAKHVSVERWAELKALCQTALTTWRASSRSTGDDAKKWTDNFWMTGEVWDHGVSKDSYHTVGKFDSIINFHFPKGKDTSSIGSTWASYASALNNGNDGYNVLSYLNSHDARQNYGWVTTDVAAGTCLLLSPGGVQIYYGDEVVRPLAGDLNYDKNQCTRSDYKWSAQNTTVLAHWQKLGTFRREHVAVGAGSQTSLGSDTYGRTYTTADSVTDKVVIKINASGSTSVSVSGFFDNGTTVRNHYDNTTAVVANGAVTFTASNGVILIEKAD